jgi:hypothetical protein
MKLGGYSKKKFHFLKKQSLAFQLRPILIPLHNQIDTFDYVGMLLSQAQVVYFSGENTWGTGVYTPPSGTLLCPYHLSI